MQSLHGVTHAFGVALAPLPLCMDVVLQQLVTDGRLLQCLNQPKLSAENSVKHEEWHRLLQQAAR